MPALLGGVFRDGGPLLAVVAVRLPWLLAAAFAQSALVACRREDLGFRLVAIQGAAAVVLIPLGIALGGPWGAGWGALGVEAAGALVGWGMLAGLGVAPGWAEQTGRALVGCLGLFAAWRLTIAAPLPVVVAAGVLGYAAAWRAAGRFGAPAGWVW
jgi:O-antigen/teichoic acid export membrane protein